jgi:hypothetical protein
MGVFRREFQSWGWNAPSQQNFDESAWWTVVGGPSTGQIDDDGWRAGPARARRPAMPPPQRPSCSRLVAVNFLDVDGSDAPGEHGAGVLATADGDLAGSGRPDRRPGYLMPNLYVIQVPSFSGTLYVYKTPAVRLFVDWLKIHCWAVGSQRNEVSGVVE